MYLSIRAEVSVFSETLSDSVLVEKFWFFFCCRICEASCSCLFLCVVFLLLLLLDVVWFVAREYVFCKCAMFRWVFLLVGSVSTSSSLLDCIACSV